MTPAAGVQAHTVRPDCEAELVEALREAAATASAVEIVAGGGLGGFGRPVDVARRIDVSALTGVATYEPEELVITVRAGTLLADLERLLQERAQCLAFEPPDLGPLLGAPAGCATIGGIVSMALSGPRRFRAGAVRDHVLGARAVSGRAELFVCGGKVVKNVTGYDLPKLLAGSFGTLAVLCEITMKVVPAPAATCTLLLRGLPAVAAVEIMSRALHTAADVSGACHLPVDAIWPAITAEVATGNGSALTALRLEGSQVSVAARLEMLRRLLPEVEQGVLQAPASQAFWCAIGAVAPFIGSDRVVWRLSVPPARGGGVLQRLLAELPGARGFLDWGGGLIWLELADAAHAQADFVRAAVAANGGHATLVRATPALRRDVAVFQPPGAIERRLVTELKRQFDPCGILNPGRMYAEI